MGPAEDGAERVLVLTALEGQPGRGRRRPRRAADPEALRLVPITRATLTLAVALEDRSRGSAWLKATARDRRARALALSALRGALERAAIAWAISARTAVPGIPSPALAERLGFGSGEMVAEGLWEEAMEMPGAGSGTKLRRPETLEGMSPILAGRQPIEPSVVLALRAHGDLLQGRRREAAIGIDAALRCAEAGESGPVLDEATRTIIAEAASRAATEEPTAEQVESLRTALEALWPKA